MPGPPGVLSDSDFDGRALGFAPDGSWLAAAGGGHNPEVRVWDLDTFEARTVRTGWLDDFEVAPDASWLVTVADDRSLRLRDGVTGQIRADLTAERPHPNLSYLFGPRRSRRPGS
jgi:WD40 repeat protein